MDVSAVNTNLTVDDFDSVISYPSQSDWQTPDPSSANFNPSGSPWWEGTYHQTSVLNASFSFNFTGPAIFIYGGSGSAFGSYQINIDSSSYTLSAHSSSNDTTPHLLYSANSLTYGTHSLTVRNLGAQSSGDEGGTSLLFDYLQTTVQLAPAGATVSNTTLEETDPSLTYTGTWGNNTSPNFSGGGSTFTQEDNASFSFSFHSSAIYIFGDKKNDHGLYSVYLDNTTTPQVFDGISGCGGVYGMNCEQMRPTLAYFASNLGSELHTLKLINNAGVNNSFFDLDSIVLTVPSVYAPVNISNSTTGSSPSSSASPPSHTNSASSLAPLSLLNPLLLCVVTLCCFLKSLAREYR